MDGVALVAEVAEILTSGIVSIGQGIATGIGTVAQSLFIGTEGTGLSVFGTLVLVFAAVSLAFGLSRWILNFITSLGQNNN